MHRIQEMVRLRRLGVSSHEVARQLRMSPNTERRHRQVLEAAGLMEGPAQELPSLEALKAALNGALPARTGAQEQSTVEGWRGSVAEMLRRGAGPQAMFDKLRLEEGFKGSLGAVKRMVARLKREEGVRPEDVAIPVVTAPGEVGQVDFGSVGKLYDPKAGCERKAYVFVMVLGYSRRAFYRVVFDQSARTWLELHVEAFSYFGGAVAVLVPDNLKAAVLQRAFGTSDETELNRSYVELARHYGCQIDPTPVRAPEKKGKVESAVKYVKGNFFRPRTFVDVEEANQSLDAWNREVADRRVHGTTGRRPIELFEDERAALRPLPAQPFELTWWGSAKVQRDSHVAFEGRLFSVPWQYVGQRVWLRATRTQLRVFSDEVELCRHGLSSALRRVTVDAHLPEHRVDLRHRSPAFWQERARAIGEQTEALVREIFEADQVLSPLRQVQALVMYLEGFPVARAEAACQRARLYGNHRYVGVKRILEKGLDLEELPETQPPSGLLTQPRFARAPEAYLPVAGEVPHVTH